jgi:hypothetical protein
MALSTRNRGKQKDASQLKFKELVLPGIITVCPFKDKKSDKCSFVSCYCMQVHKDIQILKCVLALWQPAWLSVVGSVRTGVETCALKTQWND